MNHLPQQFYVQNRIRLAALCPNAIVVIAGNKLMQRTNDTAYPFRQESNLLYLTGATEPQICLVIDTKNGREFIMTTKKSKTAKIFDGDIDTKQLAKISGINEFVDYRNGIDYIANQKSKTFINCSPKFKKIDMGHNPFRREVYSALKRKNVQLDDVRPYTAELRVIKQPQEIEQIESAVRITKDTLNSLSAKLQDFKTEAELQRYIDAHFSALGVCHAYDPIIAAGKNATTLHYIKNNALIMQGDALLFDVGAEVNGYAADISRTYIVGDNPRAQQVIKAVEHVQKEIIANIKPNASWKQLSEIANTSMLEQLKQLKINNKREDVSKYFPHAFGHFLGLDVHDVGDYTKPLQAGMVLTVEPGIYIEKEAIGVRIEDDVLVTKTGNVLL